MKFAFYHPNVSAIKKHKVHFFMAINLTEEPTLHKIPIPFAKKWGYSSAGRALAWHARGQRFDPA